MPISSALGPREIYFERGKLMDERIHKILEAGILAPSGDNCQPWRFEVEGDLVRLYNMPDRDVSQYNFRQRASLIAHGALIENMSLAASLNDMKAEVVFFPNKEEADLIADIRLVSADAAPDPLAQAIAARCTNRRRYRGGELDDVQQAGLISATTLFPEISIRLFSGTEQEGVARVIGVNDRLVFENRDLHAFLFDHIRWSDAEAEATKDGMDVRTLELAPLDALAIKLFKNFDLVRVLNHFGASRIIGANAMKLARSAAIIGVISMAGKESSDYVTCGRAMERVWLEATRRGLSFQLMTGITCLMGRVAAGDPGALSPEHIRTVTECRNELKSLLGNDEEEPIIVFRAGIAEGPTARSLRLPMQL